MNERIQRLRTASIETRPHICAERARLVTRFYRKNQGAAPAPLLRARCFKYLCEHKTLYIGDDELIVGERGPSPKATPTFPELTCHSSQDLSVLNTRPKTGYGVSPETMAIYEEEIIPFWSGRSLRDRIFSAMTPEWIEAYAAGVFTEFMEQRAPGHTAADGKIYQKGMMDLKLEIAASLDSLETSSHPGRRQKTDQLLAMDIAADAVIRLAERHGALALQMAERETNPERQAELEKIAEVCSWVPANAPRDFHEALQAYWFCHVAVITELNGWDSFSPGHLDQHLEPFYREGLERGLLTRDRAKELLACFFIKFNNHPAPPKVGVTAQESGTYTDFATINLAGQTRSGKDATGPVSYLLLEVIDELHILQPGQNVQISSLTCDAFLLEACRVIRKGYGFPSVFNSDCIVKELVRQGKSVEDAREGGTSGCVEAGAFGKEAYILTGYFNLPKLLELALNNGADPSTGRQLGPETGDPARLESFEELFRAWRTQMEHFLEIKLQGNRVIERLFAEQMPQPFLSLITDDCITRALDYNAGGARYNTSYIQGVGIGTLTDSLAAIKRHVFDTGRVRMDALLEALGQDFKGEDALRERLRNKSPKWGNDDDHADGLMKAAFEAFFEAVDGRPNERGGTCHIAMLPTTCHVYFGSVTGASADGRGAGAPLSEGISPVQGMDLAGPTAVVLSAAKMDHEKTGGTLLNMKFLPQVLSGDTGLARLAGLIRTYFKLGGHHIQFNVIDRDTLCEAQENPGAHRNLMVRVAGYSDYFCDLSRALQDEIISRTEQTRA